VATKRARSFFEAERSSRTLDAAQAWTIGGTSRRHQRPDGCLLDRMSLFILSASTKLRRFQNSAKIALECNVRTFRRIKRGIGNRFLNDDSSVGLIETYNSLIKPGRVSPTLPEV
jgi:hypothetical protein